MTLSGSFKIEKNWGILLMPGQATERRELVNFSSKPLVEIYLDLHGYTTNFAWIVPYLKDIQGSHGLPFKPGVLMKDAELISRGLNERFYDPSQEGLPLEELRSARVISLNTFRMRGLSLNRHSSRTGTLLSDIALIAFDVPRLASAFRYSEEKMRIVLQAAFFMLGYLHDIGKLSRAERAKHDICYIHNLPRIYSPEEYTVIQGHVGKEAREEAWQNVFRVDPKTVPRIINIMGWLHHTYKNGDGYPVGALQKAALSDTERFLVSVIKLIDETEAGTALDRSYKPKKKTSEISREISTYVEKGLISERAMKCVSSLLVDDGGLSNISKLVKVPEIELTLDNHFQNATIVFDELIERLDRIAKDEPTRGLSGDVMRAT